MTLLEFAQVIQRLLGTNCPLEYLPLPENDPVRRQPDIARAQRVLDWAPVVDLEEGLRRMIAAN